MKCSFSSPYIQQSSDAAQVIQETTDKQEKGKQTNVWLLNPPPPLSCIWLGCWLRYTAWISNSPDSPI